MPLRIPPLVERGASRTGSSADYIARPRSARKLRVIVSLFVVIFLCFLGLDYFRIQNLTAIRAYVQGEGLWSKAQKESVIALRRYSRTQDEKDYQTYLNAIAVPLGDRQGRQELEKDAPDFQIIYKAFLQGGIHPDDVQGMATLFRRFRKVRYMSDAVETWTLGDYFIVQLQSAADALHVEILTGHRDPKTIETLIRRIDNIDNSLTPLENQFSDQMRSGSRMLSYYLTLFVFGFAGLLLAAGVTFSLHLAHQIERSETDLEIATGTLKASEKRFRSLIQDLSDVILVLARDGSVQYASHSAERIFGYSPKELLAKNIFGMIHHDNHVNFRNSLETAAVQQNGTVVTEFRLRRKDESWIDLEATGNPMSDGASAGGIVLTCRDITERRRLEFELGQSQKMEAVGRLAGGIAHDFNNILMIIHGYAELILDRLHPQDPLRESTEPILTIVDRGSALTKRLLSFSRKQVMNPRNLDLKAILEDMAKVLPRLLGAEIEVIVTPGAEATLIHADHLQIEQVLINLAVNSRDAMPHGGKLTIETANIDIDAPPQAFIMPGSYVLLAVTDTGCGMATETKSHMFDPFFTTKEEGKGTGLGLSIVYGIIKRSGGYITVESELNAGTCMKIYFPRVDSAVEIPEAPKALASTGKDSGTVLLVEDEDLLREVVCEFLTRAGYTVLEATSGAEALAALEKFGQPVDVLVTDVILPKARGPELARQIRERWPDLRVIYMSGFTGSSLVRDGILERDTVLLQKPFKLQELTQAIRDVLSKVRS